MSPERSQRKQGRGGQPQPSMELREGLPTAEPNRRNRSRYKPREHQNHGGLREAQMGGQEFATRAIRGRPPLALLPQLQTPTQGESDEN